MEERSCGGSLDPWWVVMATTGHRVDVQVKKLGGRCLPLLTTTVSVQFDKLHTHK